MHRSFVVSLIQDKQMHLQDPALAAQYKEPLQAIIAEMIIDPGKSMTPDDVKNIPAPMIDAMLNDMDPVELAALDAISRSLLPDAGDVKADHGEDDWDEEDWGDWGELDEGEGEEEGQE